MTCGFSRSRLWESNPRPTHYEGRPHRLLGLRPASLLSPFAAAPSLEATKNAGSRHETCHDDLPDEAAVIDRARWAMPDVILAERPLTTAQS